MVTKAKKVSGNQHFYGLIHEVTALLVGAKAEEIDILVDDCLGKVSEFFQVSQVGLGQWSKAGKILPSLRTWGPKPVSVYLETAGPGPEAFAFLCHQGSIIWNCLEDLEELPQLQQHLRQVGAMAGVFCLYHDHGSHTEHLVMAKNSAEVWPEDTLECLNAVGTVLYTALYRRRTELEMERLRQLEQIVGSIASKFVHMLPERIDAEIEKALELVCKCVGADISTLFQWQGSEKLPWKVNHEWKADFIDGPLFHGAILEIEYPWLAAQLRRPEALLIDNPGDFPVAADAERVTCERIGIRSMLWVPFTDAEGQQSHIMFGTINRPGLWLKDARRQLGLVGNVFTSAIERQHIELKLRHAYDDIKRLKNHLEAENITLREEIKTSFGETEFVGRSHALQTVVHQIQQVASTNSTVLFLSETGTGKSHFARLLHRQSDRKDRPLVTVNCAALPAELIESELFGHEKGAFTGAVNRKIGRFELADGATIFLDEIGDLPIQLQAKLLRVLQDHEFERLGSSTTRMVDARVIAATNRDLNQLIDQGKFRNDLYYRLSVFPIRLPPLREHRTDIPLLVWFFITELQGPLGKTIKKVTSSAMDGLTSYDWPGNIRELRNVVERAMILSQGTTLELENAFSGYRRFSHASSPTHDRQSENLEDVERTHIVKVLEECNWKIRGKGGAAECLGLKRTTLQSRMKRLGIQRPSV